MWREQGLSSKRSRLSNRQLSQLNTVDGIKTDVERGLMSQETKRERMRHTCSSLLHETKKHTFLWQSRLVEIGWDELCAKWLVEEPIRVVRRLIHQKQGGDETEPRMLRISNYSCELGRMTRARYTSASRVNALPRLPVSIASQSNPRNVSKGTLRSSRLSKRHMRKTINVLTKEVDCQLGVSKLNITRYNNMETLDSSLIKVKLMEIGNVYV